jgi:hypothetical protein
MTVRLLTALVLASAALAAAPVMAGPRQGGLPLDPELLPPNSGPGDCVVRRVTDPGGAYRWDRVECDTQGQHQWRGQPLRVETGDRYSERYDPRYAYGQTYGYDPQPYAYQDQYARERVYDDGYEDMGHGGRGGPVTQYPPPYAPAFYGYAAAGRDAYGYLVWPGKLP